MTRRSAAKLMAGLMALLVVAGAALAHWYRASVTPAAPSGEVLVVRIEPGSSAKAIAAQLEEQGLVRSATAFEIMLALTGKSGDLRAGHYELSPTMAAEEIADKLASGDVAVRRVTIPEGLRIEETAERIAEAGLATKAEFLAAAVPGKVAQQPAPLGGMKLNADSLEGYLFPETYDFEFGVTPVEIAARMVHELHQRFVKRHQKQIAASDLSLHEIITLASMVEREARVPEERPMIAGVYVSRLARDMLLQCDATVQYALGEHKSRLLYRDLKVASPYNTYVHKGLPPGPIASPGLASLEAALSPAETDYLYYVAGPDGAHVFSRTYEEHCAAIERVRAQ